jgi:hypothetical protein
MSLACETSLQNARLCAYEEQYYEANREPMVLSWSKLGSNGRSQAGDSVPAVESMPRIGPLALSIMLEAGLVQNAALPLLQFHVSFILWLCDTIYLPCLNYRLKFITISLLCLIFFTVAPIAACNYFICELIIFLFSISLSPIRS